MNEIINPGPSRASYHTIARAMRCLRSYKIAKEIELSGNVPEAIQPNEPMQAGTLVHTAAAHIYANLNINEQAFRNKPVLVNGVPHTDPCEYAHWREALSSTAKEIKYGQTIDLIETTMAKYERTIAAVDKNNWDIESIETEYEYTLRDVPEHLALRTQRADLVIRDRRENKFYIVDHKKVWRLGSVTEDQFLPHGQFIGYSIIGYRYWADRFGGVILNRICLQGPKYDRTIIIHNRDTIRAFVLSLKDTIRRIEQYSKVSWKETPGVFDEQVCKGKYEQCPFMNKCIGF